MRFWWGKLEVGLRLAFPPLFLEGKLSFIRPREKCQGEIAEIAYSCPKCRNFHSIEKEKALALWRGEGGNEHGHDIKIVTL
jgi:hypothetical protein